MKRIVIVSIVLMLGHYRSVNGQPPTDTILIRTVGGCELYDQQPGTQTVTVHHHFTHGALATRFRIEPGAGATLVYVSEVHHVAGTLGNSQDGVQICYSTCTAPLDDPIITITYLFLGTSPTCAELRVVPHPDAETVDVIDCSGSPITAFAHGVYINPVLCGPCLGGAPLGNPAFFSCTPLATHSTTWGAVKAFYR